jgi:hypothetical protein
MCTYQTRIEKNRSFAVAHDYCYFCGVSRCGRVAFLALVHWSHDTPSHAYMRSAPLAQVHPSIAHFPSRFRFSNNMSFLIRNKEIQPFDISRKAGNIFLISGFDLRGAAQKLTHRSPHRRTKPLLTMEVHKAHLKRRNRLVSSG